MAQGVYKHKVKPVRDRVLSKVKHDPETGCWVWIGTIKPNGYGKLNVDRKDFNFHKTYNAHRLTYQLFVGPIPPGKELDHLCRNRACVNPKHLELVTHRENIMRGIGPGLLKARHEARRKSRGANTSTKG